MEHTDMHRDDDLSDEIIDISHENILSELDDEDADAPLDVNPGSTEHAIIDTSLMPEIRGLELLKKAGSALNVGRTIKDMFAIIKSMETQLKKVLAINASMEKDLDASKEVISNMKTEKQLLEQRITDLEHEMPSKRELQAEIDHLIEERNIAQPRISDMKTEVEKVVQDAGSLKNRIGGLEEEKSDLLKEIGFLEVKVGTSMKKVKAHERAINMMKGERLIMLKKMKSLGNDCKRCEDEKDQLVGEIKESREAINEVNLKLAETEISSKKAFYEVDDDEESIT